MEELSSSQPVQQIPPSASSEKISVEDRFFSMLSYLVITVLATLATKKNSPYCMFHASQGLTLAALDIAFLVLTVVAVILSPALGYVFFILGILTLIGLHAIGIYKSIHGEMYRIPFVYALGKTIDLTKIFAHEAGRAPVAVAPAQTPAPTETGTTATQNTQPLSPVQATQNVSPTRHIPYQNGGQDMVGKAVQSVKNEKN